jgi:integrase/recombinase XerD
MEITPLPALILDTSHLVVPALIGRAGERTSLRFVEFFTVNIKNANTRAAYGRAAGLFLRWCEERKISDLTEFQPVHVATYIEHLRARDRLPRSSSTSPACGCSSTGW